MRAQFALAGHQTLVVSTDPAHSLSDSLDQDVRGGQPVLVDGTDGNLWGLEIDPEEAKEEFSAFVQRDENQAQVEDFLGSVGLGGFADQLAELRLGELLDTPPPGLDEAIAITKVVQFTKQEKYAKFTRIVFDTAPTGHTLRLLTLPEFLDKSVGKIVRLRQKLTSATSAVKSLFGAQDADQDEAVRKLEDLKSRLQEVRTLFRDEKTTEFIIATIPTVLGVNESARLLQSLREEHVPCRRIVVNQVMKEGGGDQLKELRGELEAREAELREAVGACGAEDERAALVDKLDAMAAAREALVTAVTSDAAFMSMKRKDQSRAKQLLAEDAGLASLQRIEAPLFDLEIRGVPALQFFGMTVWD